MKPINIFLLTGQSNMAGRGIVSEVDPISHDNILMLRYGQWQKASEPLYRDKANAGVNLGMSFAHELVQAHPDALIGLVPVAIGGTSLDQWKEGGYLYQRALFEAYEAESSGEIQGILWHQGEGDSGTEERANTYEDRFGEMMSAFRRDLGNDEIPVVVGELGYFLENRDSESLFRTVNEALNRIGSSFPGAACVSAEGLTDLGDEVHFDAKSLREFGRRYAKAFNSIVGDGWTPLA